MAYSRKVTLFCLLALWLTSSRPAFAEGEYLEKNNIMCLSGTEFKNIQFKEW
jgi:hypothetical protein